MSRIHREISWDSGTGRKHDMTVTASHIPGRPSYRQGHPDNWTPEEAAVMEDLRVWLCAKSGRVRELSAGLVSRLEYCKSFMEALT